MRFRFNPKRGLIVLMAEVEGKRGTAIVRMALDTGATRTTMVPTTIQNVGCRPSVGSSSARIATAERVKEVPRVSVRRIKALGEERSSFPIISQPLPPEAGVHGLLGLDFFRGKKLVIDLKAGLIEVL